MSDSTVQFCNKHCQTKCNFKVYNFYYNIFRPYTKIRKKRSGEGEKRDGNEVPARESSLKYLD